VIFLSYSHEDEAAADEFVDALAKSGYESVFHDVAEQRSRPDQDARNRIAFGIRAGEAWIEAIGRHVKRCRALILLCSEHSMKSKWCFAEAVLAKSAGKLLIPIKISPCTIPPELADVQILDFTTDKGGSYQALCAELKRRSLDPKNEFQWDQGRAPYPGLTSFEKEDAAFFFGRSDEIDDFVEDLNKERQQLHEVFVFVGPSGCGKSSFVRAGVLPRLRKDPAKWCVIPPFRPTPDPLTELARALTEAFDEPAKDWTEIRQRISPVGLEGSVEGAAANLSDFLNELTMKAGTRDATIVLVLDQMEELFTKEASQKWMPFLELVRLTGKRNGRLAVLATMRSDSLEIFEDRFQKDCALPIKPVYLKRLSPERLREIIEKPAGPAGIEIEPQLVNKLLSDMPGQDELPWLALALRALYLRSVESKTPAFTLAMYQNELKGVEGVVAREIQRIMGPQPMAPDDENALRDAFLRMTDLNERDQFVRKPVAYSLLSERTALYLARLIEARFLISRTQDGERQLEVAHEALFRVWPKLAEWLRPHRDFLTWRKRHLQVHLAEYEAAGNDKYKLLQRTDVARAKNFRQSKANFLAPDELEYIERSIALQDRQRTWRMTSRSAVVVVCVTVIVGAVLAVRFLAASREIRTRGGTVAYDRQLKGFTANLPTSFPPDDAESLFAAIPRRRMVNVKPDLNKNARLDGLPRIVNLFPSATLSLRELAEVRQIPELEKLDRLVSLDLSLSGITDLDGLENLFRLSYLDLHSNNELTETLFLGKLTNLTYIDISHTRVNNLRGLENLSALKTLKARKSHLPVLTGAKRLPHLEVLELANTTTLTNVFGLTNFTALRSLDLSGCTSLAELAGLESLLVLTNLDIRKTAIKSIILPPGFPKDQVKNLVLARPDLKISYAQP
jgi:hypothetical protein